MSLMDYGLQKKLPIMLDVLFAVVIWNISLKDFKHLLSIQSVKQHRNVSKISFGENKTKKTFSSTTSSKACLDHHYL